MSNSNLSSLKREIKRMQELARETRPSQCVCRYIEIVGSEPLSEVQANILEANRLCFDQNHERAHTGFIFVEVPAAQGV
jgi:hypothetical protein